MREASHDLVLLVDELGMDTISLGVTLSYAMEHNRRHPDAPIADGLAFGDAAKTAEIIERIGTGHLAQLGVLLGGHHLLGEDRRIRQYLNREI